MPDTRTAGAAPLKELKALYLKLKADIDTRLGEFKALWEAGGDKDVFTEMCFCMCTPQNNAKKAWVSVLELSRSGMLFTESEDVVRSRLQKGGVRFYAHKAGYIIKNRAVFYPRTKSVLRACMEEAGGDAARLRNDLAQKVAGWGMKEASHFLRNTGFGARICILDRHILRQLVIYGVIDEVPASLSKTRYLDIERSMLDFSKNAGIPSDALDLVFWFKAKNELFK